MSYEYILYEREGQIARITLNRPEKLNTMSFEMFDELVAGVKAAEEDDDVKVAIIKGAGRAFCAGYDLTQVGFVYGFGTGQPGERRPSQRIRLRFDRHLLENLQTIFYCAKPTIAQVHGYCIGGGLYTSLCCDITIAAEDAQIGHAEQRLGFAGTVFTLPIEVFLIGPKKARELLLTGRLLDGIEAERIGLVNKAVPADQLEEEVNKMAQAICLLPRDGIAIGKAMTHLAFDALGMTNGFIQGYIGHTLFTNLRFEPDEYNFFKERRDKGAKAAFHRRDERFVGLI